jgi:hypothetical protein
VQDIGPRSASGVQEMSPSRQDKTNVSPKAKLRHLPRSRRRNHPLKRSCRTSTTHPIASWRLPDLFAGSPNTARVAFSQALRAEDSCGSSLPGVMLVALIAPVYQEVPAEVQVILRCGRAGWRDRYRWGGSLSGTS